MKLNNICLLILLLLCFVINSCNNHSEINIVPLMLDGLENELIRMMYADDIRDVYEITYAKHIEIWYYEIDLNDNGYKDIIAIVRSPLHSGSRGDSFNIWTNNGNDEYNYILGLTARIIADDPEYSGSIYISNENTNGFKNVHIISENDIKLVYQDGKYVIE